MKSWLRNDSVYQSIMSGALLIVFLAALSATHWPQLSLLAGIITAVMVGIVAVVYWAVVVCGDDDRANAERQPDVSVKQQLETEREQQPVASARSAPLQKQEVFDEYATRYAEILKRIQDLTSEREHAWKNYAETSYALRNWLVHQPHHGSRLIVGAGASLKSHRRAHVAARGLANITAGDETGEKVVVMVGSVRIEIQEDDPNKTTTVHITSPDTIVTKVGVPDVRGDQPKAEPVSHSKPNATIH